MQPRRILAIACSTLFFISVGLAETIVIGPGDNIQDEIVAAQSGDILELTDGTFTGDGNRDIDYLGKAITIRSQSGNAEACIIECDGGPAARHRGFYFHSGEGQESVLENVTITGGYMADGIPDSSQGGAIFCENASPTITGCIIRNNTADHGGGIAGGSPVITDCDIDENSGGWGGGVNAGGSTRLDNCRIRRNDAAHGGGILTETAAAVISGCLIEENTAQYGGGISHASSDPNIFPTLESNTDILDNSAEFYGGGIHATNKLEIEGICTIGGNTAGYGGGGIYLHNASPDINRTTISGNHTDGDGGGLYCGSGSHAHLTDCSISGNTAEGLGDGVYTSGAHPTFRGNFSENGWAGYNESASEVPDAQECWWGDASGPWHATYPLGGGDSLSLYFHDFFPFRADPYATAPPLPPTGLEAQVLPPNSLDLTWDPVPLSDLAGYRVYYDNDESGQPYENMVDVGDVVEHTLEELAAGIYYVAVTCYDLDDEESWYSVEVSAVIAGAAIPSMPPEAATLWLRPAAPNPIGSGAQATLTYALPRSGVVRLTIHDLVGRQVRQLVDQLQSSGEYSVIWDGRNALGARVAAGTYWARLEFSGFSRGHTIVVVR